MYTVSWDSCCFSDPKKSLKFGMDHVRQSRLVFTDWYLIYNLFYFIVDAVISIFTFYTKTRQFIQIIYSHSGWTLKYYEMEFIQCCSFLLLQTLLTTAGCGKTAFSGIGTFYCVYEVNCRSSLDRLNGELNPTLVYQGVSAEF